MNKVCSFSVLWLQPSSHLIFNRLFVISVINLFDIIAILVEDKYGVVAGVIIALTGGAVILATMGQRGLIKAIHHGAVLRLKGEVMATGQYPQRGGAIDSGDKQFVCLEVALTCAAQRNIEDGENGRIKALAGDQIFDHQLDMVDQPTTMQGLCFHTPP